MSTVTMKNVRHQEFFSRQREDKSIPNAELQRIRRLDAYAPRPS